MKRVLLFLILFLPARAVYAQSPAQWRLTPDLRIGSLDDAEQSLTTIAGVSIGPDGLIFIAQPRDWNVRVHDAAGRFVRVIGRKGGGPGEFESISAVHWRSDTLYVNVVRSESGDTWLRREDVPGDSVRWNVLSPSGDVLAAFALPKRSSASHRWRYPLLRRD